MEAIEGIIGDEHLIFDAATLSGGRYYGAASGDSGMGNAVPISFVLFK